MSSFKLRRSVTRSGLGRSYRANPYPPHRPKITGVNRSMQPGDNILRGQVLCHHGRWDVYLHQPQRGPFCAFSVRVAKPTSHRTAIKRVATPSTRKTDPPLTRPGSTHHDAAMAAA